MVDHLNFTGALGGLWQAKVRMERPRRSAGPLSWAGQPQALLEQKETWSHRAEWEVLNTKEGLGGDRPESIPTPSGLKRLVDISLGLFGNQIGQPDGDGRLSSERMRGIALGLLRAGFVGIPGRAADSRL